MPEFTSDWFSHNIPLWDAHVAAHLTEIASPNILEIGSYEGRSTVWLAERFPTANITAIDPWAYTDGADQATYRRFMANIQPFGDRIKVMRGKSQLAWGLPQGSFDMVYVDGDHKSAAVIHDAVIAFELVKPGGLIVFDDYMGGDRSINYPGPAIDFFHQAYGAQDLIELVSDAYQRMYRRIS